MGEQIDKKSQFDDTPEGWASRWQVEISASKDALKKWHDRGDKVIDRFTDERDTTSETSSRKRLNLFHGDVETKRALLYGNPPRVRCRRRHADADDDVARVSAEMLERILNTDIDRDGDGFVETLGLARDDRLLPGLGQVRSRYVVEMEDVPEQPAQMGPCPMCGGMDQECPQCSGKGEVELAPAVPAQQRKRVIDAQTQATEEDVETDYVHWQDFLYPVMRTWDEVYWVAFEAEMTLDQLHERFDSVEWMGPDRVDAIPRQSKRASEDSDSTDDPWSRACVWEIWCEEGKQVFWYVEGYPVILDRKDDPLGLEGFFPCPQPMMANVTTKKLVPVPDFAIAQDLYDEIDDLYDRIYTLTKSMAVKFVYDSKQGNALQRLADGGENEGIPVPNWAQFSEAGGIKAAVQFFPTLEIANAIAILSQQLVNRIGLKDQATGIADVMRGAATGAATATEQRIKARFGSTRIQAAQDEFARFVTDTQKIRAEIIAKHWDPGTIIERSNVLRTPDAQYAQQAAALLKSDSAAYRIEVASDALAMTDFDALKGDRVEFLQATAAFMQQIGQLGVMAPQAVPYLLEFLKHGVSGFRGAAQLEGVLDRMISAAQQAAKQQEMAAMQPKPPDPRLEKAKIDAQTAQTKAGAEQFKAKADVQKTVLDLQATKQKHAMDMQKMAMDQATQRQSFGMRMAEQKAEREEEIDVMPMQEGR